MIGPSMSPWQCEAVMHVLDMDLIQLEPAKSCDIEFLVNLHMTVYNSYIAMVTSSVVIPFLGRWAWPLVLFASSCCRGHRLFELCDRGQFERLDMSCNALARILAGRTTSLGLMTRTADYCQKQWPPSYCDPLRICPADETRRKS
jgi:hypothetical protein